MEFTASKHDILQGLYKAQSVVDRKGAQNILSHVLIESTSATGVRFTCTDYDVVLRGRYAAEVERQGRIAVGAKGLFDVVKALPDKPVHITGLDNHWIQLRCGTSRFKLAGLPPEDFPEIPEPDGLEFVTAPKRSVIGLIERTSFSVSRDETRPSINGAYFRVAREGDGLHLLMVSTDGHRLSKAEVAGGDPAALVTAVDAILHHKAIGALTRSMEGPDEDVRIAFRKGNAYFANDEVMLEVRALDERFPDYTKVIPKDGRVSIDLDLGAVVEAIKRIATLTSAKSNIIQMEFLPGRIVLTSQNPEAGEGRDEVPVDYDGEELTVGLNFRYVLDAFGAITGDTIRFSIHDMWSPGVITSPDDPGTVFVIMPMRI